MTRFGGPFSRSILLQDRIRKLDGAIDRDQQQPVENPVARQLGRIADAFRIAK